MLRWFWMHVFLEYYSVHCLDFQTRMELLVQRSGTARLVSKTCRFKQSFDNLDYGRDERLKITGTLINFGQLTIGLASKLRI